MRIVLALATSLIFSGFAAAASVEDDVQRYIQIFSGEKNLHNDAADTFSWMGLSDTRLFDIVERRLLEDADASRDNRNERNRVARYIRSLGFSGQTKYEPTIKKFLGDVGYNRFAQAALQDLPDYNKWNPIISNRSSFDPKFSDNVNRVANMLQRSDSVAWQAKALGSSKNEKYVALLREVAEKAVARHVVTHATEALAKYYGIRNR
ncbi:MAG: hypothetical protein E6H59_06100 [Betaproteobacteria bacterium]|nr:MAG: hypothetical protein E6H59_06100 [Betaproteobacteria bacterium]